MKGLILKDFYTGLGVFRYRFIMMAFYLVIFWGTDQIYTAYMLMVVFSFTTVVNVCRYDETSHWDRYICSGPVNRRQVILAKYLAPFIMWFATAAVICACELIRGTELLDILTLISGIISGAMVFRRVSLACVLIFGSTKGTYAVLGVTLIPTAIILIIAKSRTDLEGFISWWKPFFDYLDSHASIMPIVLLAGASCFYAVSYLISTAVYEKRDL